MLNSILSKRFFIGISVVAAIVLGIFLNYLFNAGPLAQDNVNHRQLTHQQMIDISTDIFHGKVIGRTGSRFIGTHREYQYNVAIQDPNSVDDKGSVTGQVVVSSTFGTIRDGSTMVFYTIYNAKQDWYSIIAVDLYDDFGPALPNPPVIQGSVPITVSNMDAQYITDLSDPRILVGASHNIFIGKVLAQTGETIEGSPETQFSVNVIKNIKGNLRGTITVDQIGGYKGQVLYLMDSQPMLKPGSSYLFATRYNSGQNWNTLISYSTANKLLSDNANLNNSQIEALAANSIDVQRLSMAYPNEILLAVDIAHNNTLNSYASTHVRPPLPNFPLQATSTRQGQN